MLLSKSDLFNKAIAWVKSDVDLYKSAIRLRETKRGVEHYAQRPSQATEFLKMLRLVSDKYLFPSQLTRLPIQQKYLTEQTWRLR